MEENLVGYLLKALDPDTQRQVEEHVRNHPETQAKLELIRGALEPLRADAEEIDLPPTLAMRTLARVAEYCCQDLPRAPVIPPRRREGVHPSWWRRADVLVAASLFLCLSLLIPPLLNYLRRQEQDLACTNNLREYGSALISYSNAHNKAFPNVADYKPRDAAGMFLPVLLQDGDQFRNQLSIRCPGNGPPVPSPWTLKDLQDKSTREFGDIAPNLVPCYAYSLGYRGKDGEIHGLVQGRSLPIMADRPPRGDRAELAGGNSPNHGGRGQNVLFTDGHVEFLTSRKLAGDDIFLNKQNKVAAGTDEEDTVLAVSQDRP